MITARALENYTYNHCTFASIHLHLLHAKSINTGSNFSLNIFIPQWLIFTVRYDWSCLHQEAGKASAALQCHQHSHSIQTDFPEHITLQLHKMHLSSLFPLNTFLLCLHGIFHIHWQHSRIRELCVALPENSEPSEAKWGTSVIFKLGHLEEEIWLMWQ